MRHIVLGLLVCCCLAASPPIALSQTPPDVPQDHWAYAAVNDLASKGLIKGYPPSGDFFGKRTVTRYEMAVVVQRSLARVDELLAKKADAGPEAPVGVTQAQLDEVRKLVDEYKVELTVIGTDMQKVKTDLAAVQADVATLKDQVAKQQADIDAAKQGVQSTIDAVHEQAQRVDRVNRTLSSHKIGGYLQSRFEAVDTGRTSLFPPNGKGGPGVGTDSWYGFQVRRARLKLSGNITDRTDYALQADFPSSGPFNLKDAWINIANLPAKSVDFTAGSFLTPFGFELNYSSADRWSPERAMAFSDSNASSAVWKTSGAGGAVPLFLNQEYDLGAGLTWYPRPDEKSDSSIPADMKTKVVAAVVNGEGFNPGSGVKNSDNSVDAVARVQSSFFGHKLGLGISGYYGSLAVPTTAGAGTFVGASRQLLGADVSYTAPWKTTFRGEYVAGIQETSPYRSAYLKGNHVQGWDVQAKHPITGRLDGVLKYEEYMPIAQAGVSVGGLARMDYIRKAVHAGLLYQLDAATRLRLWYERGLTPYDPSASSGPLRGRFGFITGEVQVKY